MNNINNNNAGNSSGKKNYMDKQVEPRSLAASGKMTAGKQPIIESRTKMINARHKESSKKEVAAHQQHQHP